MYFIMVHHARTHTIVAVVYRRVDLRGRWSGVGHLGLAESDGQFQVFLLLLAESLQPLSFIVVMLFVVMIIVGWLLV